MRAWMLAAVMMLAAFAAPQQATQQAPHAAGGMIQGSVLRSGSRTPVPSALITLKQVDGSAVLAAVTGRDGSYTIDRLPAGKYALNVHRDGFFGPAPANSDRLTTGVSMSFVLSEHEKRSGLDFVLIPGGSISGRILDPFGRPSANREVQVSPGRGLLAAKLMTDDRGEYRIYWLSPGSYNVSVIPPAPGRIAKPQDSNVRTYYPGTADVNAAVPVSVGEGEDVGGIDFTIQSTLTVTVSGNVQTAIPNTALKPDGSPAERSYLFTLLPYEVSSPAAPSSINQSNTASDRSGGHFELRGVQPGSYDLVASLIGSADSRLMGHTPITVGYVNLDNVRVNIEPGVDVKAKVTHLDPAFSVPAPSERRIDERRIELVPMDGAPGLSDKLRRGTSSIDNAGRVTISNVLPGRYLIRPTWPEGAYVADVQQEGRSILTAGLTVTGSPPPPIDVTVGSAVSLSGSVIQGEGPASRLMMVLVPDAARGSNPSRYKSVVTTVSGAFTIDGIMPGNYKMFAAQGVRPEVFQDAEFLAQHESLGQGIMLSSAVAARHVTYRVGDASADSVFKVTELPAASLQGILHNPAGAVMSNVAVILIPQVSQRTNSMLYFSATTNTSGAFRIPNVVAGEYTLVALQDLPAASQQNLPVLAKYDASGQHISLAADATLVLNYIARPDPAQSEVRVALPLSGAAEVINEREIAVDPIILGEIQYQIGLS